MGMLAPARGDPLGQRTCRLRLGFDSVSIREVVNRLLVADRLYSGYPRVTLGSQGDPALTRGYNLSPTSWLSEP